MNAFRRDEAIAEVRSPADVTAVVAGLLRDPAAARAMADRARQSVLHSRGATARHVDMILARPELRRAAGR